MFFKKLRWAPTIVQKPLISGILGSDFVLFRPKVGEILNYFSSFQIN
jgi:hypothetical protein